jgi:hypothetical protein
MNEVLPVEDAALGVAPSKLRRVSWGAIFAGVFFATVVQVMFTLLGAAVGFGPLRSSDHSNSGQAFMVGSGIWLLVTGLVSTWMGACVAGRLSGGPRRADGMLHGVIAWSVSTVIAFGLLATAIGGIIGGTGALVNEALSSNRGGGAENQQALASIGEDVKALIPQAGALLPPTGRTQGQTVPGQLTQLAQQDPELSDTLAKMENNGGAPQSQQERDQVVNLLTSKHNMSKPDAEKLVNQWDTQFRQAKNEAGQQLSKTGKSVEHGVAQGAFWGFLALFLGLLVSAWGGWAGTASLPRPTA